MAETELLDLLAQTEKRLEAISEDLRHKATFRQAWTVALVMAVVFVVAMMAIYFYPW